VFDDMLKKPCPYQKTLVNHTLEKCDMLKKYYSRATAKEGEAKNDGGDGTAAASQRWRMSSSSSGGGGQPWTCPTASARGSDMRSSLWRRLLPPSSGDAITFSREDHPNRIPNPGQYRLVVDPFIGNSRFSKVLMDGGNSLNILYAHTLRLMGIGLDQLRPSTTSFHGVAPGKRV
jgi:hypothetical protein